MTLYCDVAVYTYYSAIIRVCFIGGVEKWKDEKLVGGWKSKYLVFPCVYLVGGMEKWEGGKLFCLVEKKSERIESIVYIN